MLLGDYIGFDESKLIEFKEFILKIDSNSFVQNEDIKNSFKKLLPQAIPHRTAESRGFNMPNIKTARLDFERLVGMKIDWAIMTKDDSE